MVYFCRAVSREQNLFEVLIGLDNEIHYRIPCGVDAHQPRKQERQGRRQRNEPFDIQARFTAALRLLTVVRPYAVDKLLHLPVEFIAELDLDL